MKFPSTLLPQTNDPKEIQKGILDLLDKINQLAGAGTVAPPLLETAAYFSSFNPTPLAGQLAIETDTKYFKFGDGTTAYNSLTYQWKQPFVDPATKAPLPQSAAGVGQFLNQTPGITNAWVLPAGGVWIYAGEGRDGAALLQNWTAGIAAGGTTVGAALGAGAQWLGWAYREA